MGKNEKGKWGATLTSGAIVLFASASLAAAPLVVGADSYYVAGSPQIGGGGSADILSDCAPDDCDCVCGWECDDEPDDCDCDCGDCDCGDCDDGECDCS